MNNQQTQVFNLVEYLAADLHRANQLKNLPSQPQNLSFWLGILSPRFIPILLYRLSFLFYTLNLGIIAKLFSLVNFFLFGIEIAINCPIGKGLFLPHTQGTVIGAWKIGENATIFQGVTIGAKQMDFSYQVSTRPNIGDNVTIGSGAKILGGINLGDSCSIGANAVVLNTVEANQFAAGIPAKIIKNNTTD